MKQVLKEGKEELEIENLQCAFSIICECSLSLFSLFLISLFLIFVLTSSLPLILKNVAFDAMETARAIIVLPVPGGPNIKMPFGGDRPSFVNTEGVCNGR